MDATSAEIALRELRARFDDIDETVVAFDDSGEILYANAVSGIGKASGGDGLGRIESFLTAERPKSEQVVTSPSGVPGIHLARVTRVGGRRFTRDRPRARLFEAVFEVAPAALVVVDDERRLLAANRHARRAFGMKRKLDSAATLDDLVVQPDGGADAVWTRVFAHGRLTYRTVGRTPGGEQPAVLRIHANALPGRHVCMYVPVPILPVDIPPTEEPRLSAREREILSALAAGERSTEIAERLYLSAETVRTHVRNAMRKLGARSRVHAVIVAISRGELSQ